MPVYDSKHIERWSYSRLAPHYPRNYTLGGPTSAKPGYSGFLIPLQTAGAILEAQPYIVDADLSLRGGAVDDKPSDFLPLIDGEVLNKPYKFVGSAVTDSPVGEVAMVNSVDGTWYLWSVDLGVAVATLFATAPAGGGMSPTRVASR